MDLSLRSRGQKVKFSNLFKLCRVCAKIEAYKQGIDCRFRFLIGPFSKELKVKKVNFFKHCSNYVVFVLKLKLMKQGIDCRYSVLIGPFSKELEVKRSNFSNIVQNNYVVFVLKLKLMKQGIDCRYSFFFFFGFFFYWTFLEGVEVKGQHVQILFKMSCLYLNEAVSHTVQLFIIKRCQYALAG